MDLNEKISLVVQEAGKHLLPLDVRLIKHLLHHDEPSLMIELVCDLFLKDRVFLRPEIARAIQEIVSELKIDPNRSWENLVVIDEKTHEPFRIYTGKDTLEKRRDIESIYLEVRDKFKPEHAKHVMEFIDVGEYELALEGLWRYLYDEKIVISRDLMAKIRIALSDNELDPETWVELLIEDK